MKKHKILKNIFNFFFNIDTIISSTKVSEVMVKNVISLHKHEKVQKSIEIIAEKSIAGIVVLNPKNKPVGMVSEGDLFRKVILKNKDPKKINLSSIMSKTLLTVDAGLSIRDIVSIMDKEKVSKLPVLDAGKLVGIITKHDVLKIIQKIYKQYSMLKWLQITLLFSLTLNALLFTFLLRYLI